VIDNLSVEAASGDRYSILLYGDNATFGLRTRLLKDEIPNSGGGALLRVVNGVTQAADVTVSIGSTPSQSITFGGDTGYVSASGGAVNVSVVRTTDGSPIRSGPITLESGRAYTLLLAGEIGYYTKSVLFTDAQ
jgi:microcystin degradation protein MlrC